MRLPTTIALLLSFTAGIASAEPPDSPPPNDLPLIVRQRDARAADPLWLNAEAAVTSDGALRQELFSNTLWAMKQNSVSVAPGQHADNTVKQIDCRIIGGETGDPSPPKSVAGVASRASAIYVGKVVEIHPGFLAGSPRSLVKAETLETIRPLEGALRGASEPLFIVHDYARFGVGELTGCFGFVPIAPGDRFIAFMRHAPLDDQSLLFLPGEDVFIEGEGGVVKATAGWNAVLEREFGHHPTFDEFVAKVRASRDHESFE